MSRLFGVQRGFFFLFFAQAARFFFGDALAFGVLRFFARPCFAVAHRFALGEALLFGHLLGDFARAQFFFAAFFGGGTRFFRRRLAAFFLTGGFLRRSGGVFQAEFFFAAFFRRHVFGQRHFLRRCQRVFFARDRDTRFFQQGKQAVHGYFQLFGERRYGLFCYCHFIVPSLSSTKPRLARFQYQRRCLFFVHAGVVHQFVHRQFCQVFLGVQAVCLQGGDSVRIQPFDVFQR